MMSCTEGGRGVWQKVILMIWGGQVKSDSSQAPTGVQDGPTLNYQKLLSSNPKLSQYMLTPPLLENTFLQSHFTLTHAHS